MKVPLYDPAAPSIRNAQDIIQTLPHRYPFQMVDKIIHLDESSVTGVKNVTINEPFFQGHFPEEPIMPGVLQLEALAQAGGILILNTIPDPENYLTYLLSIDQCRFRKPVRPGDTLILHCELLATIKQGIAKVQCGAFVNQKLASEAIILVQITPKKSTS